MRPKAAEAIQRAAPEEADLIWNKKWKRKVLIRKIITNPVDFVLFILMPFSRVV